MKNPHLAFFYSILVPGLGQIYLADYGKGWTFLCMDAGILVSLWFNHSWLSYVLMGVVYLTIAIPAGLDAFQNASGRPRVFSGNSVAYIILMLLVVGPFAIPLLWQSSKFSKRAKIGWTVFVILIALLMIATLNFLALLQETLMQQSAF